METQNEVGVRARAFAAWKALFKAEQGPRLLCCGEWGLIKAVPHQCRHCQRVYFVDELPALPIES